MMIDWYVGKRCNFACSYCADFIHDNFSEHVPFEKMKMFVDKIVDRYGTYIHWSLTGGEPTLNPDFIKLLEYLQDKKFEISVCTNGSRSKDYLIKLMKLVDNVTFSLHFEHISSKLDEYVSKSLYLQECITKYNQDIPPDKLGWDRGCIQPKRMVLRFMVLPGFGKEVELLTTKLTGHIDKIEHRVIRPQSEEFLKKSKILQPDGSYKWSVHNQKTPIAESTKVAPDASNSSPFAAIIEREQRWYSEEDVKTLNAMYSTTTSERKWLIGYSKDSSGQTVREEFNYNEMNLKYKTNFKGWLCNAGMTLLKVAPNGDIFIANCFQGGAIANIYSLTDDVKLPTQPVICSKDRCTDPMDLRQDKIKLNS